MEQQGHLPPAGDEAWRWVGLDCSAAASPLDSTTKLEWLAARGWDHAVDPYHAMQFAAGAGNMEALQLLLEQWRERQAAAARVNNPLDGRLLALWL